MAYVSTLAKNIVPSMTVELKSRISELRSQGLDIISLTSGEPDMDTPANICEAAKKAMDAGKTKYSPAPGIMALRKAICKKLELDHGLHYEPAQTCVSTGAKQAIFNAVLAICNRGDEVLLPNVSSYYGAVYQGKEISNSLDFCNYMIEQGVAFVPGSSFYAPNCV